VFADAITKKNSGGEGNSLIGDSIMKEETKEANANLTGQSAQSTDPETGAQGDSAANDKVKADLAKKAEEANGTQDPAAPNTPDAQGLGHVTFEASGGAGDADGDRRTDVDQKNEPYVPENSREKPSEK
jgi:hypothetical protein